MGCGAEQRRLDGVDAAEGETLEVFLLFSVKRGANQTNDRTFNQTEDRNLITLIRQFAYTGLKEQCF